MGTVGGEENQRLSGHEEKIVVSVRLRPLNEKETAKNDVSDWDCINDDTIIFKNNLPAPERSMYPSAYTFDRVFRCDCSTRQVYEEAAKEVALSVVSGINSSIFAYGQTSSGKTYTMRGITDYTMADIYNYIETHAQREFLLKFSAMEIYNESVRDLLSADSTPLRLLDDPERGTIVEKLTEEILRDWYHLKQLLSLCEAQRQIGETALNETSSRSHQIIRLTVESSGRNFAKNSTTLTATVNFVDLAGSERASQSLSAGSRLKEGCHINRSLLTLGTVIRKLSKGRNGHVPFRDSKLTRILQSSLAGNARTAIICTMSPARSHVEQSRNTLLFASCAKEVTTNAQVNIVMSDKALVKHLQRELSRLEMEIKSSGVVAAPDTAVLLREKDIQIEELMKEISKLTLQRDIAQSQVEELLRAVEDDESSISSPALDNQYPQLRVRKSWGDEEPTSDISVLEDSNSADVRSLAASQNFDQRSLSNSGDHDIIFPDFSEDDVQNRTPTPPRSKKSCYVTGDLYTNWGNNSEADDASSDDNCKDVRCIEIESSMNTLSKTNRFLTEETTEVSGVTMVADTDKPDQESVSRPPKEETGLRSAHQSCTSPHEELLDVLKRSKLTRSRSWNAGLPTSLSSPIPLLDSVDQTEKTPPYTLVKELSEKPTELQSDPAVSKLNHDSQHVEEAAYEYEVDHIKAATDEIVIMTKKFANETKEKGVQVSVGTTTHDELDLQLVESYDKEVTIVDRGATDMQERISRVTSGDSSGDEIEVLQSKTSAERELPSSQALNAVEVEDASIEPEEPLVNDREKEDDQMPKTPKKSVRDIGLDPIPYDIGSPLNWTSKFQDLQKEIIDLWHACNISLVHRTYFYLLFKGDPTDSIYMEVELRRLHFLRNTFLRGGQTSIDGKTLTLASSGKALFRERVMLSRRIEKKFSEQDRENLYLKWGIHLNSKNRRLQLAQLLWTNTEDMDHITDSANLVAKLVKIIEPENGFKEMFGLNFTPTHSTKQSLSWKLRLPFF
uniref:Kinesin motor domain-containing protein n=1 Tax=Kalanchoe fedtschenkoi TaxID=63787 RepID=A0A7N0VDA6_KALFE